MNPSPLSTDHCDEAVASPLATGTSAARMNAVRQIKRHIKRHIGQQYRVGRPALGLLLLFVAVYVGLAGVGQGLNIVPGVAITFWPPAGVFVATLLLNQRDRWPWFVAAACIAELIGNALWFGNPPHLALVYFSANALEAICAAWWVAKASPGPFRLNSFRQVLTFVGLAGVLAPMVGATVIATTDALLGRHDFTTAWPLVWLGDGSGLLVSTPLTLMAVHAWRENATTSATRRVEAVSLSVLLLLTSSLAMLHWLPTHYVVLPLLLWAALRFQVRGAAAALAMVTLLAAALTALQHAGLAPQTLVGAAAVAGAINPQDSLDNATLLHRTVVEMQTFLCIAAVSTLLVAALAEQHRQALLAVQRINGELELRVRQRTASLQERNEALRLADQRKDEFLAMLAHELRNPLSPILHALELMRTEATAAGGAVKAQATRERALAVLERQSRYLARLVDDLLDVSRVTQGKIRLHLAPTDLQQVIEQAVELARPLIEAGSHRLELRLPAAGSLRVHGDSARLTQVFGNVLNNAAKYTPAGGRLAVHARIDGAMVLVQVQDNGTGIAPELLPHVFELFTQESPPLDRSRGGLGIGLSLVKSLTEMHGGRVSAASSPGQGSTFEVRLPLMAESDPAESAPAKSDPAKSDPAL